VPVILQNRQRTVIVNIPRLRRVAGAVLAAAHAGDAELSVLLVSDRRMRQLNLKYRNKDRSTDVLAFPLLKRFSAETSKLRKPQAHASDVPATPQRKKPLARPPMLLGDVVISMPTALRQAAERGHGLFDEVVRLLIHGILHLVGYDHERGAREAARMARKERAILSTIR
jgi:probable rRNA maturation factor